MKAGDYRDWWIISDTHFFHDNIVKYCNRPEDHTERIAKAWREDVQPDDIIFHLGDVFMGIKRDDPKVTALLHQLPGSKYLIMGNHDRQKPEFYRNFDFTVLAPFTLVRPTDGRKIRFSHYPEVENLDWDVNIHGHIHNNGYGDAVLPPKVYRNVSIEVMDYKPVRLGEILDKPLSV